MLKQIFWNASLAVGASFLIGCSDHAAIDKQKAAEAQAARTETLEIVKFLEEKFPLSEPRISLTNIPSDQKAAMVRFVKLVDRLEKAAERHSAVMHDLQKMEPEFGKEDEPRISRLEFIHRVGEQNAAVDVLLNKMQIILMDNAKNMHSRHLSAFKSCTYTATHRSSQPTQTKTELEKTFPAELLEKAYPRSRETVDAVYGSVIDIEDTLKTGLYNTGFANPSAYQPEIDRYEAGIAAYEQEVSDFAQAMKPEVADLKSSFAQMRHKSLLLQVNIENCAVAIEEFNAREGAFSDVPVPQKPVPGPSI